MPLFSGHPTAYHSITSSTFTFNPTFRSTFATYSGGAPSCSSIAALTLARPTFRLRRFSSELSGVSFWIGGRPSLLDRFFVIGLRVQRHGDHRLLYRVRLRLHPLSYQALAASRLGVPPIFFGLLRQAVGEVKHLLPLAGRQIFQPHRHPNEQLVICHLRHRSRRIDVHHRV